MASKTITEKVLNRIRGAGRGAVFTPKDFLDFGSRGSIGWVLYELTRQGKIRRIGRGLYDLPRQNAALGGELSSDIDRAAYATARKFRWNIMPDPTLAANLLGLSKQIPAKIIYLSDGPTKTIRVGRRAIHFKHARPKAMNVNSRIGGMVIQALRYVGRSGVDETVVHRLRTLLSATDKRKVLDSTRYAADWIYEVAKEIAEDV